MSFIDDNYDYSDQSGYESNLEVSQENLQDEITESEVREMVVSQPREMVMTPPREMIETPPVLTPSPYEVINAETPKFCCSGDPSASFIKDTSNTDGLATEEDEGGVYCDEEGYVDSEDDEDWVLKSEMYLNNNTLDSDDDSDEDEGYNEPKQKWVGGDYIDSTKVVCSVENILKLMQRCQDCGEKLTQKVTNLIGGAVTVNFNCCNQHKGTWTSSPIIEPVSGRGRKATEIDLMFGTYIESSTMKVSEFHRMCDSVNLLHSTPANHYKRLADKAHRAIQESFQDSLNEAYTEMINHPSNSLTLCGDMRYDSRRKAKHGTYSIICQETEKVVANVVIHIDEANGQSGKLEEIGVLRALNSIPEEVLNKCGYFVTDENLGVIGVIADWNNARFLAGKRVIEHQLCSWHRNKNLMSKLKTFVSKTGGAILLDWSSSISRHWYHTLMTSKDNPSIIQEKLLSIPLHMQDIHTFPDNIEYKDYGMHRRQVHQGMRSGFKFRCNICQQLYPSKDMHRHMSAHRHLNGPPALNNPYLPANPGPAVHNIHCPPANPRSSGIQAPPANPGPSSLENVLPPAIPGPSGHQRYIPPAIPGPSGIQRYIPPAIPGPSGIQRYIPPAIPEPSVPQSYIPPAIPGPPANSGPPDQQIHTPLANPGPSGLPADPPSSPSADNDSYESFDADFAY